MNNITKTFRAVNMMEALQLVQQEFGVDALVISMRKINDGPSWQVWKNPMVEVIAMKKTEQTRPVQPGVKGISTAAYRSSISQPSPVGIAEENELSVTVAIQNLSQNKDAKNEEWRPFIPPHITTRQESQRKPEIPQRASLSTTAVEPLPPQKKQYSDHVNPVQTLKKVNLPGKLAANRDLLLQQGLGEDLVSQIITTCMDILPPGALDDDKRIRYLIQRQLEAEIRVVNEQEIYTSKPIFVIGTFSSGKKLVTAQLSAMAKQRFNKTIRWVCADTIRTGAITEARTYTELLNLPLHLAYTPKELAEYSRQETQTDLVFVDMPDFNPRIENSVIDLGDFLTHVPNRTTLLAVSATTKESDLLQIFAAVKPFRIKGLIFTQMTESMEYGNIYQLARNSQIPLAYFSTGIHIFNDLQTATASDLVDSLFGEGYAL